MSKQTNIPCFCDYIRFKQVFETELRMRRINLLCLCLKKKKNFHAKIQLFFGWGERSNAVLGIEGQIFAKKGLISPTCFHAAFMHTYLKRAKKTLVT